MGVHVKDGTPLYGPSLCETCERALVVKGYRETEHVVVCQAAYPELRVKFAVRECTRYTRQGRQGLQSMEEMAWTLVPRGPARQAGFLVPATNREETREVEIVLDENRNQRECE
jgi:hypothetical protein